MQVYTCITLAKIPGKESIISCYFIISTYINDAEKGQYDEYIEKVKPIVERFGGKYLVRSEKMDFMSKEWKPDRLIVIEFLSKEQLEQCFASDEYRQIKDKREQFVDSRAIIVEGVDAR